MSYKVEDYEKLAIRIAKLYFRQSGNYELEDLIQAARIGIHNAIKTFDPDKNVKFLTYAYDKARYEVLKYLKENTGVIQVPQQVNPDIKIPDCINIDAATEGAGESNDTLSETKIIIEQAMSSLKPQQRTAIIHVHFGQLTLEEAAGKMNVSKQRVHQCLQDGLNELKETLLKSGLEVDDFF